MSDIVDGAASAGRGLMNSIKSVSSYLFNWKTLAIGAVVAGAVISSGGIAAGGLSATFNSIVSGGAAALNNGIVGLEAGAEALSSGAQSVAGFLSNAPAVPELAL